MMKRLIAILAVVLIASPAAFAQTTQYGRIALYADEGHSVNEVWNTGGFTPFTMYIFCLPGENGMICAEFAIDYPDNIITDEDALTENPGMSVSLGELETGMSFCFVECQTDWVWTHSQLCYLTDPVPSQISIIEHPLTGMYQFANCLEEFPTEPCFYGPSLCLNSSCPLDTDPPGFASVHAVNSTEIVVHFDEEVLAGTAGEMSNYTVYEAANPGNVREIIYAELWEDQTSVTLRFALPMGQALTYRLEADNIYDIAGNALPPGSYIDFTGVDNDPPTLEEAFSISPTEVAVVFSEPVTEATAENIWNYEIYREDLGHTWEIPIAGAELQTDKMTVHLALGDELVAGYTYVVEVSNVRDLSGNEILDNSTAAFQHADEYPPDIVQITTPDYYAVHVVFDESLDSVTATDPGNYGIVEKLDTLTSLTITGIELYNYTGSATVHLHLADPLEESTLYLLRVSGVTDRNGNAIPPGTEHEFQYEDIVPPEITGAEPLTNTLVEVVFSEEMDPGTTENTANYEVFEKADPAHTIPVSGAALQGDGIRVHLTLGDALVDGVTYTVEVSGVEDLAGNPIPPGRAVDVMVPDTTPPGLVAVTVPDPTVLYVEFTEKVDETTAGDPASYWLFATGDPGDSIPVTGAERLADETTVMLSLALPLTYGNSYTLKVDNVEDLSGNPIPPGSEIAFTAEDTYPPGIASAAALTDSLVEVVFDEEVDQTTAEVGINYSVYRTDDPDPPIAVAAAVLQGDGRTVHLTLYGAMAELVEYTVRVSNVEDVYGNAIDPPALYSFVMPDITPPVLVSANAMTSVSVRVVFNEQMDPVTAGDASHYQIYQTANPSSTVPVTAATLQGNGKDVQLSLDDQLTEDVEYTVSVSDVMDVHGNPIAAGSAAVFMYGGSAWGCIGLYADDQHSVWCVNGVGFYPVEMWIWCLPSDNGFICAEFAVSYPSNTIQSTVTENSEVCVTLGDLVSGMSVCICDCTYDWVWPFHQTIYVTDPIPTTVDVIEHPEYGLMFSNCFGGYPVEPANVCTQLYINCDDATPPQLLSAASESPQLVTVTFSERVTATSANDVSNYELFETADPGNTFSITEAERSVSGETVDLTLESPLTYGTSYTVRVSGIRDLSGNEIAPGSEVSFVPVNTPPELVAAEGMSRTEIDILFTEPLDSVTAEDAANYEVYATADSSDAFGVTGADLQANGRTVRLTVDRELTENSNYTVRVSNVEDHYGLAIAPGSTVAFTLADRYAPELVSVEPVSPEEIDVHFNEPLQAASAENVSNYELHETVPHNIVPISGATLLADGMTVRLLLDLPLTYGVSHTLQVSGVRDIVGNPMPSSEIEFTPHDTFPPVLGNAVVQSSLLVDAVFSEGLDPVTAEDSGNYELYELDDPATTLPITNAALEGGGNVVRLTLGDPLSYAINYVLRVNNVEDLLGNPVAPNSEVVIYETDPPGLVSVTQEDMKRLLVVFDEPVMSADAQSVSSYSIHVTDEPSNVVVIDGAGLLSDSVTVRLTLHTTLVDGTSYTLHAEGVRDLAGNSVPPESTLEFIAADTYPPELISVTPEDAHTVRVYFSEEVDEATAETASNYEIFETGNPSSTVAVSGAVLLSNGISVRLTLGSDLESAIDYTLRVSNVEDLAGNPVAEGTEAIFQHMGPGAVGYIGLYTDYDHTEDEVWYGGSFMPFTYYIWCLPSTNGMICAEFATEASPNIIRSTVTSNTPIISVSLGDIASGMSVCLNNCHFDWTWTHQQQCYLTSAEVGYIQIIPHPDVGLSQFANCLPGYPVEPAEIISRIYVNEESEPGPGPPTATLLYDFSAAYRNSAIEVTWQLTKCDEGIEFFVLRAAGDAGSYEEIASPRITRRDLEFTFVDDTFERGRTYRYRVEYRIEGKRQLLFETEQVATPELPLTLYQNVPNPFNPTTTIRYYLPAATHVVLEIYDVSGRRVACPVNRHQEGGHREVEWNGIDDAGIPVSSGVYFYRLIADRQVLSRKMVLLR